MYFHNILPDLFFSSIFTGCLERMVDLLKLKAETDWEEEEVRVRWKVVEEWVSLCIDYHCFDS